MYKIRDNVDLKELYKFNWIPFDTTTKYSTGSVEWLYKDIVLKQAYNNHATMYIDTFTKEISLYYDNKRGNKVIKASDDLICKYIQDLILAGLVEEVSEHE